MRNLSQEILKQVDDCAKDFEFPMLDNGYVYPADTRMSVYANQGNWAIIIEVLGYNPRAWQTDGFDNCLYCFGNSLINNPGTNNLNFLFPISDGISASLFAENDPEIINPEAKDLKIRDNPISVTHDPEIYTKNGIVLENHPSIHAFELLRLLSITHRNLLLATESELKARLSGEIPLILRLDEWNHPDVSGDEKPSDNETFVLIAEMIDKLDVSIYHPSKSPNTHWSNWANGGTL